MKTLRFLIAAAVVTAVSTGAVSAQGRLLDRLGRRAEEALTRKAEQAVDKAVDKVTNPDTYRNDQQAEPAQQPDAPQSRPEQQTGNLPAAPAATQTPSTATAPAPYTGPLMALDELKAKYANNQSGVTVMTLEGQFAQGLAARSSEMGVGDLDVAQLIEQVESVTMVFNQSGQRQATDDMRAVINNSSYTMLYNTYHEGTEVQLAISKEVRGGRGEIIIFANQAGVGQLLQIVGTMSPEAHAQVLQAKADGTLERAIDEGNVQ